MIAFPRSHTFRQLVRTQLPLVCCICLGWLECFATCGFGNCWALWCHSSFHQKDIAYALCRLLCMWSPVQWIVQTSPAFVASRCQVDEVLLLRGRHATSGRRGDQVCCWQLLLWFFLATQHVVNPHERGTFRENPPKKLSLQGPLWSLAEVGLWCMLSLCESPQKAEDFHNMEQLRQLPTFTCGHIHDSPESAPYHQADGSYFFPSYTAQPLFHASCFI